MNVSRETDAKLTRYVELLREWQERLNLVAPSTLADAHTRHIDDSLQLLDLIPSGQPVGTWIDLGSGAGFPGLVAATVLTATHVHLVESRAKKCRFLETVADDLGIADRVTVHPVRIESMAGPRADVISARACAALPKLFDWGLRFQAKDTLWVLPKGRTADEELDAAKRDFAFDHDTAPSRTDPEAKIILARNVKRLRAQRRGAGS